GHALPYFLGGAHQLRTPPRHEAYRRRRRRRLSSDRLARSLPGTQPAVEHVHVIETFQTQVPPESRGPEPHALVIHDHRLALTDSQPPGTLGELLRRRDRPRIGSIFVGEVAE